MQIKNALGNYDLKLPKGFSGKLLKYEEMSVEDFKIDKQYQRHISPAYIKRGGPLDLSKLTPIVVCKRPDSLGEEGGYYAVDGQHRCLRVIHSDYDGNVPVCIYEHAEDTSLEECIRFEAQLFHDLNSLGKKPTKMDEVRAGIYSGDKKALRVLDVMETLNLTCDNFGSEKDDAMEIEVFTHFYLLCTQDYPDGMSKILEGFNLMVDLFPEEKTCNSYLLRACCLIKEFMSALTNGKQLSFTNYIQNKFPEREVKAIVRGYANAQSPMYILHDAIERHNEMKGSTNIGPALIDKMSNKTVGGNPRFKNPNA